MTTPARVGLIGCGGIGRAHAEAVDGCPGAVLAAVADVDTSAAADVASRFGSVAVPLLAFEDPNRFDLVIVATPPATHLDVVERLLLAKVPVLCEKPLAIDLGAARKLVELSDSTGTLLTMAAKFRFVDEIAETRELIRSGALGDVVKVEVSFASRVDMNGRWNSVRSVSGGGVIIDNATHAVDLVRYLIGPITEVLAAAGPAGQPIEVEDSATLLARTAGGVLAQIDVTWSFARLSPTYVSVLGTAGTVEIGWKGARAVLATRSEPHEFGTGYRKIDSLRANLQSVLDTIAAGAEPPVTLIEAQAAAAVVEASYASLASGGWVRVEERP